MTEKRLHYGFLHNHHRLVKQLDLKSLLPSLIADGLVTNIEQEHIKGEQTPSQAVDRLLTILHRRYHIDQSVFKRFLAVLSDEGITAGQNLGPLVQRIEQDSRNEAVASKYQYREGVLMEEHNTSLRAHEETIVSGLSVEEVLPELIARGVVSPQENDSIRKDSTATKQVKTLLDIVERRGSIAYSQFVTTLKDSDTYSKLGQQLESITGEPMNDEKYVEAVLKEGHVPPQPKVFLPRPALTERIHTELRKLKEGDRWLVVHGMAGSGKTVLAAEAIRNADLLRSTFPGGVHWLTVGQMNDQSGDLDNAKLLNKLQTIILRLDEGKNYRPPSVETATDYLQEVISKQHPNSLLILDDVWTTEVAQAFSVRCRVMVTSRNAAVAERVYTTELYNVSVSEGLSDDASKELLAGWLKTTSASLPQHVDTIVAQCRGSPMAIALIGAILKRNCTEQRWKQIAERLEKKHFALQDTLKESIKLSVESLPKHLQPFFEMFVIIDYDMIISRQALDTFWNTDQFDTEDYVRELVGYSLVVTANTGTSEPGHEAYLMHDLVLDYLKDSVSQQRQTELHQLVVKRYRDKCDKAYHHLPNDGYVYQKLMGHLTAAGFDTELGELMTQLRWLMAVVEHCDANTYLADYRRFKGMIPEQFLTSARQFELFLSGHMYVLANEETTTDDILQLALLLPDTSAVFEQATAMTTASVGKKRSWFKWSNKWSDPEKYALKLKLHHHGVVQCHFSPDEGKVLSCAGKEVKLWDASTGMVLGDYKGHKDDVTGCDLAPSGKILISSSEDCSVKVWDTRKKTVLINFTEHVYGVQCCALSPDETLVLSADVDSVVMLWSARTGKVQSKWRLSAVSPAAVQVEPNFTVPPTRTVSGESHGGGEGVESCIFSPGGEAVVTSSQNGAVRMWGLDGQLLGLFSGHNGHVRCCVFSRDGELLATASLDKTAKVWNVLTRECDITIDNDEMAVLSCAFSPDGTRLLTGDTGGSVKVWGLPLGTLLQDFPNMHLDFVNCVLYSPKANFVLSAADNGLIKIMWMSEEIEEDPEPSQTTPIYHRRFSVHFRELGSEFSPLIVCYATKEKRLQVVVGEAAEVVIPSLPAVPQLVPRCWVISNNGSLIAIGYEEGTLQVISLCESVSGGWEAKEIWRKDHAHENMPVVKIYFSPKSNKFVSCSAHSHKVWLALEGRELSSCKGRGMGVCPCVFFEDSVRAASAAEGGVLIWNTNTGEILRSFTEAVAPEQSILCVALSTDNMRLAASATNGNVMIWDVPSGTLVYQSPTSDKSQLSSCARSCALSPDGSLVAAGFDDGSLQIWNVSKRKRVRHCPTDSDYWMIDLAFSPDGSNIVTLSDSIEWWRTDGSHAKRVMLKGTFGKYIRFSPDFMTFVTIDNAGLLYIFTTMLQC